MDLLLIYFVLAALCSYILALRAAKRRLRARLAVWRERCLAMEFMLLLSMAEEHARERLP